MKKVFFVLSLIFSLLFISGKEYNCQTNEDSFINIEKIVFNDYEFIENSVKLEYTTEVALQDEYERILSLLNKDIKIKVIEAENSIVARAENMDYEINIYTSYDKTRVNMTVINKKKETTVENIKQILQNLRNDNYLDERYFSYVKGRLKSDTQTLSSDIKRELKNDTLSTLKINNGVITKAVMKDGKTVNIGQINYDTGSYLIIGTPMIFITY